MNKLPVDASYFFRSPAVLVPAAPAAPAEPVVAPPPTDVSPELGHLQSPAMQRSNARSAALNRQRASGAGGRGLRESRDAGDTISSDTQDAGDFSIMPGDQSSGDGEGNDDGRPAYVPTLFQADGAFDRARDVSSADDSGHMTICAADLPERCAAHHQQNGSQAMLTFLRGAILDLLPALVRDLGDKLARCRVTADACRPVGEVFSRFEDLMRPLYLRYAQGPFLLSDVRDVLCATQELLAYEMSQRPGVDPRLATVMCDTVFPLLPVFVMSSKGRPPYHAFAAVEVAA